MITYGFKRKEMYDFKTKKSHMKIIHFQPIKNPLEMYGFYLVNQSFLVDSSCHEGTGFRDLGSLEPTETQTESKERRTELSINQRTLNRP